MILGQTFYRGNDLSYVNQMEDCGAVFKEKGIPKDVYRIFADQGTNLVRVRLWHNPVWQNQLSQPEGIKPQYSDFEDVRQTISRAKNEGMEVMLDFHLSDFWADPGQQLIPSAWLEVAENPDLLADSVYKYVSKVLIELNSEGLMPELVKIGNENNGGILMHTTLSADFKVSGVVSNNWSRHAKMFNAGIKAVRDVSKNTNIKPGIVLHCSGLSNISGWFQQLINNGVTDFDIIGFSYYYSWHDASISAMGNTIRMLRSRWPQYDVMAVETAYLWTTENFDHLGNIINDPDPEYLPVSPEKQLEYMVDYAREVKRSGGIGVIFWEPAWVSTPCRTAWGVGSSHDHVVFFDPVDNNFMENGGGRWTNPAFYEDVESHKLTFKVDMGNRDTEDGVFISASFTNDELIQMSPLGANIFWYFTFLPENSEGGYFFVNGNDLTRREVIPSECALWKDSYRLYSVGTKDGLYAFDFGSCEEIEAGPVNLTFMVDMTGQDVSRGVFITGEITGSGDWSIEQMSYRGNNIYSWTSQLLPGNEVLAYYYLTTGSWTDYLNYREVVPSDCWGKWEDRGIIVPRNDTIIKNVWGSCESFDTTPLKDINTHSRANVFVTTDADSDVLNLIFKESPSNFKVEVFNSSGSLLLQRSFLGGNFQYDIKLPFSKGLHIINVRGAEFSETYKIILL